MPALIQRTADVLARWPQGLGVLTPAERDRAEALAHVEDRRDFLAAHLLAREAVATLLGTTALTTELTQRCPSCRGAHGEPFVSGRPDVRVSWAHTRGHVTAAASFRPVGVDLERLDALRPGPVDTGLLSRCASTREAEQVLASKDPRTAMLLLWVAKESLIKAGVLDLDAMPTVDLRADATGRSTWRGFEVRAWTDGAVVVGWAAAA